MPHRMPAYPSRPSGRSSYLHNDHQQPNLGVEGITQVVIAIDVVDESIVLEIPESWPDFDDFEDKAAGSEASIRALLHAERMLPSEVRMKLRLWYALAAPVVRFGFRGAILLIFRRLLLCFLFPGLLLLLAFLLLLFLLLFLVFFVRRL